MVMQDGEQQEPQDQLDADQQTLDDQAAGEPAAPQYVTLEQFNQMAGNYQQVVSQNQQLSNHISGLESRIDKQANAIRAELQSQTEALARAKAEAAHKQLLEAFGDSPEQQDALRLYLETQKAMTPPPVEPAPEPQPQVAPQQPTQADWGQVQAFVRQMGADPNDTRIDYNILVNTALTPEQRQEQFLANVGTVIAKPAPAPAAQQQAQQAPPPQSPPRAAGPAGNGYRDADDLMGAFISGKIDQNKYRELAPGYGIPL